MHTESGVTPYTEIPCCPDLKTSPTCDVLDFRRHLVFPTSVRTEQGQIVRVEVIFHVRFTRCSGPLALGDIVYSTTLLPGEKVRLATTDRRSRFSFDSESKLSYRSEQISEEQYRLRSLRAFMSDQNVEDRGGENFQEEGKWDFHGDASGSLGFFSVNADTNAKGSHSASSSRDYLREFRAHAEMSDNLSVEATRRAHSLSIGEVSSRTHVQGESEDHFESASREFSNPNKCHAVTFLFYRINKTEKIRFELVSIERRVLDPVALMPVPAAPYKPTGAVATVPQEVPATSTKRLEIQEIALASEARARSSQVGLANPQLLSTRFAAGVATAAVSAIPAAALGFQQPLSDEVRAKALAEVDAQLVKQGLIERVGGQVSKRIKAEIDYERETSIPTAGVIVKSCMDDCGICEPEVALREKLELERLELENKLLAKRIELLEKSQEYRCCPGGEGEGGG